MADSLISIGIGIFKRLLDLGDGSHAEVVVSRTLAPIEQRTNVGALAASATFYTDALDLGPAETRQHTRVVFFKSGVASAGESVTPSWSDDGVTWEIVTPAGLGSSAVANANNTTSTSRMVSQAVPPGRYVRMAYTNGATPQTALQLSVTAIAGI
jgi:hypothetical protein